MYAGYDDDRRLGVVPVAAAPLGVSLVKGLFGHHSDSRGIGGASDVISYLNLAAQNNDYALLQTVAAGGIVRKNESRRAWWPWWNEDVNFSDGLEERAQEMWAAEQLLQGGTAMPSVTMPTAPAAGPDPLSQLTTLFRRGGAPSAAPTSAAGAFRPVLPSPALAGLPASPLTLLALAGAAAALFMGRNGRRRNNPGGRRRRRKRRR